jgi:DNA cross-link repair 1A protein
MCICSCPGSVMMVFKVRNGPTILHTGDFRASVDMEIHPMLQGCHIDFLYLDTTLVYKQVYTIVFLF